MVVWDLDHFVDVNEMVMGTVVDHFEELLGLVIEEERWMKIIHPFHLLSGLNSL